MGSFCDVERALLLFEKAVEMFGNEVDSSEVCRFIVPQRNAVEKFRNDADSNEMCRFSVPQRSDNGYRHFGCVYTSERRAVWERVQITTPLTASRALQCTYFNALKALRGIVIKRAGNRL